MTMYSSQNKNPDVEKQPEELKEWYRKKVDREYQSLQEKLEEEEQRCLKRAEKIREAKEELKSLKYSKGDVIFHREYGNCIVFDKFCKKVDDLFIDRSPSVYPSDEKIKIKGYLVVDQNSKQILISHEEAIPYTKASKTLYSNKSESST